MRTVDDYFGDYLRAGFIREQVPSGLRYSAPSDLGEGGFLLMGDVERCYASLGDMTLKKDYVTIESINERMITFGLYSMGDAACYQRRDQLFPIDHGLNFYVHYPFQSGYMRIKAHQRLVCDGLILRQSFFDSLPYALPDDFWPCAAEVLNPLPIDHPAFFRICRDLGECTLTGRELDFYMMGKGYESLALIMEYMYRDEKPAGFAMPTVDRQAVNRAMDILAERMADPPKLVELAALAGTNQQKLMKGMKRLTGLTVNGYLKKLRMTKAAELLQITDLPVSHIARAVGYCGDGHFQSAFTSIYGAAPAQFRREL